MIAIEVALLCGIVIGILVGLAWARAHNDRTPPRRDVYATLIMKGEAAGCYACDTCGGFRRFGEPCQTCLTAAAVGRRVKHAELLGR